MIQVRLSRYRTRELARFPLHWSILGSPSPSVLHISYPAPHAPLQAVLHISVISLHASCDFFLFKTIQHDNLRTPFLACLPGNHHGGKHAGVHMCLLLPHSLLTWHLRADQLGGPERQGADMHGTPRYMSLLFMLIPCCCRCLCVCVFVSASA